MVKTEVNKTRNEKGQFIKGIHPSPKTEFKKGTHWRKPQPYWNKEYLENLYINQKKSAQEIANMFNYNNKNILYFLRKFNIPIRNTSEGTTGIACIVEGFNYILIEKRKRFANLIIPKRLEYWKNPENWKILKDHNDLPKIKILKNKKTNRSMEEFLN